MVIEISVAVIALAFAVLVVYLILMTKALCRTLFQVNQTLIEVRKQLDEVGGNAANVMEHTNQVSYDLKRKMESLDPLFNAFSNIGEFFEHKTFSLKRGSLNASQHEKKLSNIELSAGQEEAPSGSSFNSADVVDFIDIGLRLWQKIKKRSKQ